MQKLKKIGHIKKVSVVLMKKKIKNQGSGWNVTLIKIHTTSIAYQRLTLNLLDCPKVMTKKT